MRGRRSASGRNLFLVSDFSLFFPPSSKRPFSQPFGTRMYDRWPLAPSSGPLALLRCSGSQQGLEEIFTRWQKLLEQPLIQPDLNEELSSWKLQADLICEFDSAVVRSVDSARPCARMACHLARSVMHITDDCPKLANRFWENHRHRECGGRKTMRCPDFVPWLLSHRGMHTTNGNLKPKEEKKTPSLERKRGKSEPSAPAPPAAQPDRVLPSRKSTSPSATFFSDEFFSAVSDGVDVPSKLKKDTVVRHGERFRSFLRDLARDPELSWDDKIRLEEAAGIVEDQCLADVESWCTMEQLLKIVFERLLAVLFDVCRLRQDALEEEKIDSEVDMTYRELREARATFMEIGDLKAKVLDYIVKTLRYICNQDTNKLENDVIGKCSKECKDEKGDCSGLCKKGREFRQLVRTLSEEVYVAANCPKFTFGDGCKEGNHQPLNDTILQCPTRNLERAGAKAIEVLALSRLLPEDRAALMEEEDDGGASARQMAEAVTRTQLFVGKDKVRPHVSVHTVAEDGGLLRYSSSVELDQVYAIVHSQIEPGATLTTRHHIVVALFAEKIRTSKTDPSPSLDVARTLSLGYYEGPRAVLLHELLKFFAKELLRKNEYFTVTLTASLDQGAPVGSAAGKHIVRLNCFGADLSGLSMQTEPRCLGLSSSDDLQRIVSCAIPTAVGTPARCKFLTEVESVVSSVSSFFNSLPGPYKTPLLLRASEEQKKKGSKLNRNQGIIALTHILQQRLVDTFHSDYWKRRLQSEPEDGSEMQKKNVEKKKKKKEKKKKGSGGSAWTLQVSVRSVQQRAFSMLRFLAQAFPGAPGTRLGSTRLIKLINRALKDNNKVELSDVFCAPAEALSKNQWPAEQIRGKKRILDGSVPENARDLARSLRRGLDDLNAAWAKTRDAPQQRNTEQEEKKQEEAVKTGDKSNFLVRVFATKDDAKAERALFEFQHPFTSDDGSTDAGLIWILRQHQDKKKELQGRPLIFFAKRPIRFRITKRFFFRPENGSLLDVVAEEKEIDAPLIRSVPRISHGISPVSFNCHSAHDVWHRACSDLGQEKVARLYNILQKLRRPRGLSPPTLPFLLPNDMRKVFPRWTPKGFKDRYHTSSSRAQLDWVRPQSHWAMLFIAGGPALFKCLAEKAEKAEKDKERPWLASGFITDGVMRRMVLHRLISTEDGEYQSRAKWEKPATAGESSKSRDTKLIESIAERLRLEFLQGKEESCEKVVAFIAVDEGANEAVFCSFTTLEAKKLMADMQHIEKLRAEAANSSGPGQKRPREADDALELAEKELAAKWAKKTAKKSAMSFSLSGSQFEVERRKRYFERGRARHEEDAVHRLDDPTRKKLSQHGGLSGNCDPVKIPPSKLWEVWKPHIELLSTRNAIYRGLIYREERFTCDRANQSLAERTVCKLEEMAIRAAKEALLNGQVPTEDFQRSLPGKSRNRSRLPRLARNGVPLEDTIIAYICFGDWNKSLPPRFRGTTSYPRAQHRRRVVRHLYQSAKQSTRDGTSSRVLLIPQLVDEYRSSKNSACLSHRVLGMRSDRCVATRSAVPTLVKPSVWKILQCRQCGALSNRDVSAAHMMACSAACKHLKNEDDQQDAKLYGLVPETHAGWTRAFG